MPGMGELIVILAIVLVIFGAGKLPQIGDALGRSIRNFKRASNGSDDIEVKKNAALDATSAKTLSNADGDDDFEEVVVRRRIKKDA
jgi:sec-independent protein translocase protein TatA